ncbi:MAG: methylmalonyl Co-A mutase-associated GTPase MeaB [Anaerolineae bacterium]|nr:methylmalonyl Co-A mutase-associated GTPase MeaB [Anaerolineae bacterium]
MNLIQDTLKGNRRAIARLISHIEDEVPGAREALAALYPHTGRAYIVGVTGAPGTGKSTLVNELAKAYRRWNPPRTVGVIAVDPTSPFSGGAILGDRIRMRDLAGDAGIFVRSMATRGSLGGLARATADAIKVLDAAGYEMIFVETVGAGQAEVDIAKTAYTTIVVEAPGLGDEIQALKAGIMEIADIFAVNKADREGADHTVTAIQMMLDLNHASHVGGQALRRGSGQALRLSGQVWRPPVCKTIAVRGEGVPDLVQAIEAHAAFLRESGLFGQRERERVAAEFEHLLREQLMRQFVSRIAPEQWDELIERMVRREVDPYTAAEMLLRGR